MWYDGKGIVSIGCQDGGPNCPPFGRVKVGFVRLLNGHCSSTHSAEIDHYALALRIGGTIQDFEPERIWKIRLSAKNRYIGADIDVPISAWKRVGVGEERHYLASKVVEAFDLMVRRLEKSSTGVDSESLMREVRDAANKFRQAPSRE